MRDLVARAMAAGAVGLSTGLEYVPGTYATRDEIVALAKAAAAAGGLYASHLRDEGPQVDAAIAEAIAIGEAAGCPVSRDDLALPSQSLWGIAAGARPDRAVLSEYHAVASVTGSFVIWGQRGHSV